LTPSAKILKMQSKVKMTCTVPSRRPRKALLSISGYDCTPTRTPARMIEKITRLLYLSDATMSCALVVFFCFG